MSNWASMAATVIAAAILRVAAGPVVAPVLAVVAFAGLFGCGNADTKLLTRAELMNPESCRDCHPQQFADWSGSMHAYAAEDPVFLAMNKRGQRETNGALGDFCIKCHAPVALAEGLTTDGLNLPTLEPRVKGVTCYFCHSAVSVEGTHNNPLKLVTDGTLFGPFADPVAGTPHRSRYSALFDADRTESAAACGSCHDIVNQHGAAIERTFAEWQGSLFADLKTGLTCVRCHMNQSQGPASTQSKGKIRSLGSHALPGVDVALTPFPRAEAQRYEVQSLLDSTLAGAVCLTDTNRIEISLDNVNAGHSVPSGAAPDRRVWAEVTAYLGQQVIYQSGMVPAGQSVETIEDPDLWLIRDCLFDDKQASVHMFWEARSFTSNTIPGAVKPNILMPETTTVSHVNYLYPKAGPLTAKPDRITLRVFIKPVGDDVLQDLVASGDLDAEIAAKVPQFSFGSANLEWTPATASAPPDPRRPGQKRADLSCVWNSPPLVLPRESVSHARCVP